ncbi:MAG: dTMP kinase [Rhodospirillales bacterium]|nr:dTMP kinase [Rhodospirillales bacterium]
MSEKRTRRGLFITFEGGEGAGKSTQIARLAERLASAGVDIFATREPGGPPGALPQAMAIRRLLVEGEPGTWSAESEALLNYTQRIEHVRRIIEPTLARGTWVLCDRFADSTMAYQGYGHRLGRPFVERLHRLALGAFKPDLTLVFDIPVETGLKRALARAGAETRYERMDVAFHERLRRGFRAIARAEPKRCALVDARGDVDAVSARIAAVLKRRLGARLPA